MKVIRILILLAKLVSNFQLKEDLENLNITNPDLIEIFDKYQKFNKKKYFNPSEYKFRFQIFIKNAQNILGDLDNIQNKITVKENNGQKILVVKNSNPCQEQLALNDFMDLSETEFQKNYLLKPDFFDEKVYEPINEVLEPEKEEQQGFSYHNNQNWIAMQIDQILKDPDFDIFDETLKFRQSKYAPQQIDHDFNEYQMYDKLLNFTKHDNNYYKYQVKLFLFNSMPNYNVNWDEEQIKEDEEDVQQSQECLQYLEKQKKGRRLQYTGFNFDNFWNKYYDQLDLSTFTKQIPEENNFNSQSYENIDDNQQNFEQDQDLKENQSFQEIENQKDELQLLDDQDLIKNLTKIDTNIQESTKQKLFDYNDLNQHQYQAEEFQNSIQEKNDLVSEKNSILEQQNQDDKTQDKIDYSQNIKQENANLNDVIQKQQKAEQKNQKENQITKIENIDPEKLGDIKNQDIQNKESKNLQDNIKQTDGEQKQDSKIQENLFEDKADYIGDNIQEKQSKEPPKQNKNIENKKKSNSSDNNDSSVDSELNHLINKINGVQNVMENQNLEKLKKGIDKDEKQQQEESEDFEITESTKVYKTSGLKPQYLAVNNGKVKVFDYNPKEKLKEKSVDKKYVYKTNNNRFVIIKKSNNQKPQFFITPQQQKQFYKPKLDQKNFIQKVFKQKQIEKKPSQKPQNKSNQINKIPQAKVNTIVIEGVEIPRQINWQERAQFTPVKNQQKCNACYAFGALATLETHISLKYKKLLQLSEQEILDCSGSNAGCDGGQPYLVYDYLKTHGVNLQSDYPYQARKLFCRKKMNKYRFNGIKGRIFVKKGIVNLLKALNFGPVSVVSHASDFLKYFYNGVFTGRGCYNKKNPNHASMLYGYNLNAAQPYLLFKNNWGEAWGNKGYYKVTIGELTNKNLGHCLIAETSFNVIPIL